MLFKEKKKLGDLECFVFVLVSKHILNVKIFQKNEKYTSLSVNVCFKSPLSL